jgi:hypothetical protein
MLVQSIGVAVDDLMVVLEQDGADSRGVAMDIARWKDPEVAV